MTDNHGAAPGRGKAPGSGTGRQRSAPSRGTGTRRYPEPSGAQQRWIRQIAAGRKARRQRLALTIVGAISVLTLLASGGAWVLTSYVSSSLDRVNAGTSGTPSSGPVNILVAGIDTRSGLTRHEETELHVGNAISSNSDTLMLVHVPANHESVQVVSLPRDSWVAIPGFGMNKINAAYGLGGPQLMVRTVEQATGLDINDYIEVNFLGFVKVIDALGGVNVCVPFAVDDPYSGLRMSAGMHHVNGVTALEFARDRHSFALSDIARISDQQQLLSSMFAEASHSGVLADPIRLQEFLSSVTAAVKVDQGFNLIRLADELRGISSEDVTFTTVPISNMNYLTPTGESAVLWNGSQAAALFSWLKTETGTTQPTQPTRPARSDHSAGSASSASSASSARAKVSFDVYNGTLIGGLSAATGKQLAALGFGLHKAGLNWPEHNLAQTLIEYPPDQVSAAKLLAKVLPAARLRVVAGLARIRLVLGTSGHVISGTPAAAQAHPTPATTAAPGQQRTAAQDACQ
jgi:LCP family protein required for cell wall assembly